MPNLLLFAACQKAIIAEQDQSLSVIALLSDIQIATPEGSQIPIDLRAPDKWDIVVVWARKDEDLNGKYEQLIEFVMPNGEKPITSEVEFDMSVPLARNILNVIGIPVGQPGRCVLRLSIRPARSDEEWEQVAEYPITIAHQPPQPSSPDQ